MFTASETCDKCKRTLDKRECLYEVGKDYLCESCMESHFDQLEAARDAAVEAGVNYLRERPIRKG